MLLLTKNATVRIYLDSSVIQDLKKSASATLYQSILQDTKKNIYLFSEAHIYDLVRDKTEQKFSDMAFMETITSANCICFEGQVRFESRTIRQHYDRFDWTPMTTLFEDDDDFSIAARVSLQGIPFTLGDMLNEHTLPGDLPAGMLSPFREAANWFDYLQATLKRTQLMVEEQKEFKKTVQYLHRHVTPQKELAALGITGFDGIRVTDREAFFKSYSQYFIKDKQEKTPYGLFIDMQTGLELFGIVKGKPRKQQMMSLINDARHAFFGGYCDIVVTKDEDMINKARFMYDLHGISTRLYTPTEFLQYLQLEQPKVDNLQNLLDELENPSQMEIVCRELTVDLPFVIRRLRQVYAGYFDILTFVDAPKNPYLYFSKQQNTFSRATLVKELAYVIGWLTDSLGLDINNKGEFSSTEITKENWLGRDWVIDNFLLLLRCEGKMELFLHPL